MSDTMFYGVLRMPYEMAMEGDISRLQFYDRVQECANRCESAEAEVARLTQALADKDLQVMEAQELSQKAVRDVSDLYERQRQDGNEIARLGEQLQAANRQAEASVDLSKLHRYDISGDGPCFAPNDGSYVLYDDLVALLAAPQQHAQSLPMKPTDDMCRAAREKIGIGANVADHVWRVMAEASCQAPQQHAQAALREAVNAIYFDDGHKFQGALWNVVRHLSPSMHELLQSDTRAAYYAMAAQPK